MCPLCVSSPNNIYLLKFVGSNTRKRCEISKLTIKAPFSSVSVFDFEQANVSRSQSIQKSCVVFNPFYANVSFLCFITFSWVIEMEHWFEMYDCLPNPCLKCSKIFHTKFECLIVVLNRGNVFVQKTF